MKIESIRTYCLSFPEATEKLQWEDALCFKIRGKLFAVVGLDNPRLTFKCTPEVFSELVEREYIRPSPYLGRYKWVMLDRMDALPDGELKVLIRQSYEMVEATAPRPKSRRGSRKRSSKGAQPVRESSVKGAGHTRKSSVKIAQRIGKLSIAISKRRSG